MFKNDSSFNVLYTTDVHKTYQFFKGLGSTIRQYEEDKVVVSFGTFDLHYILDVTEPAAAYQYITKAPLGQGIIFYLETTQIQEASKLIVSSGGTVKTSVFENHWGYQELLFEDPNGYKFALFQEK